MVGWKVITLTRSFQAEMQYNVSSACMSGSVCAKYPKKSGDTSRSSSITIAKSLSPIQVGIGTVRPGQGRAQT